MLSFMGSALAMPSGMIHMEDPKMPADSIPVSGGSESTKRKNMYNMASDTDVTMPKYIHMEDPKMPSDKNIDKSKMIDDKMKNGDVKMNKDMNKDMMNRNALCHMFDSASNTAMVNDPTVAGSSTPNLKIGDGNKNGKGMHVRMLQARLIAGGYLNGTTTGNFGSATRDAVKKYQKDLGVVNPTGLFGYQTKEKMKAKCMSDDRPLGSKPKAVSDNS